MIEKQLKTIEKHIVAEITEKKSRFIANIYPIQSEDDAIKKIKEIKERYRDARHNCFAFSLLNPKEQINRFSDDGEPSGTAGAPMLNILLKNEIYNVLVVVTRYFGGILLGTGGLVKAYTRVTMLAIEQSEIVIEEQGMELLVTLSYSDFEKFKYYCNKNNINMINIEYDEKIVCKIEVNEQEKNNIINNSETNNFNVINYEIKCKKNIRKRLKNHDL